MLEQSRHPHIFVAGDILNGAVHNEPGATTSGKRIARFINALRNEDSLALRKLRDYDLTYMPFCLFSTPEIGGVGITEDKAKLKYREGEATCIVLKKTAYLDKLVQMFEVQDYRKSNLIKIIFETESRKVIGLHYLGNHAAETIQGYSVRPLPRLFFTLGCDQERNYYGRFG